MNQTANLKRRVAISGLSVSDVEFVGRTGELSAAERGETDHQSAVPKDIKRLNVNLPKSLFEELKEMSSSSGRSLTEIVRLGLGLVATATDAEANGHRLVVADRKGRLLKELILPK